MPNTMVHSPAGTLYFDAVLHVDHNANVTITQHPVQTGAVISDHAVVEPEEISLEIGMTDVIGGDGSSVQAYQLFKSVMNQREPCTVVTRLATYQDMILTSIAAPDDYTTMNALRCTLIFSKVRIVSVATVQVQQKVSGSKTSPATPVQQESSSKPPDSPSTDKPKSTKEQTESVLSQATQKQYSSTINAETVKKAVTAVTSAVKSVVTGAMDALKNAVKTAASANAAKTSTTQTTTKATTKPAAATLNKAKVLTSKNKNLTVALLK